RRRHARCRSDGHHRNDFPDLENIDAVKFSRPFGGAIRSSDTEEQQFEFIGGSQVRALIDFFLKIIHDGLVKMEMPCSFAAEQ
ncbi:hypothetical protein ACQ1Y8_14910, partial [Enterococcus faecalis]|uniref:hypothetical protein n=1 Tax=Enterococcus faecalis TaxID=1351 RepID=UPI003D6A64E8